MTTRNSFDANEPSQHILDWNDRLQDWLEEDFSQTDRAEFERHLAGCEICQEQVAQFRALDSSLRASLPSLQLGASFDARILSQIDSLDEKRRVAAVQQAEEERRRSLDALARSWRRTLAFVVPGILGGIALAFVLVGSIDSSGLFDKIALEGASELGGNASLIPALLTAMLGAVCGGIMARWLARTGE